MPLFDASVTAYTTNSVTIWNTWNQGTTSCITWDPWNQWNQGYYTLAAATNSATTLISQANAANAWTAQAQAQAMANQAWNGWNGGIVTVQTRQVTAQEQRAWDEAERRRKAEQAEADARAKKLLVETLSQKQRDSYERHGFFDVDVGGRLYRIRKGTHGNVSVLDQAGAVELVKYCIQPDGVPVEDSMLAQKLLLEADEREFLRIANPTALSQAGRALLIRTEQARAGTGLLTPTNQEVR